MRDHLARRLHAQARAGGGAARSSSASIASRQADQDELDVGLPRLEFERGRHRHMGAVVAPHAIDRDRDQRDYSSLVLTTFLPR